MRSGSGAGSRPPGCTSPESNASRSTRRAYSRPAHASRFGNAGRAAASLWAGDDRADRTPRGRRGRSRRARRRLPAPVPPRRARGPRRGRPHAREGTRRPATRPGAPGDGPPPVPDGSAARTARRAPPPGETIRRAAAGATTCGSCGRRAAARGGGRRRCHRCGRARDGARAAADGRRTWPAARCRRAVTGGHRRRVAPRRRPHLVRRIALRRPPRGRRCGSCPAPGGPSGRRSNGLTGSTAAGDPVTGDNDSQPPATRCGVRRRGGGGGALPRGARARRPGRAPRTRRGGRR